MRKVLIAAAMLLCACSYGYDTRTKVVRYPSAENYDPSPRVRIYEAGTPLPRQARPIAHIEVVGNQKATRAELDERLRKKARKLGAHAVTGVRRGQRTRKHGRPGLNAFIVSMATIGELDRDCRRRACRCDSADVQLARGTYKAPVISGIAVRFME